MSLLKTVGSYILRAFKLINKLIFFSFANSLAISANKESITQQSCSVWSYQCKKRTFKSIVLYIRHGVLLLAQIYWIWELLYFSPIFRGLCLACTVESNVCNSLHDTFEVKFWWIKDAWIEWKVSFYSRRLFSKCICTKFVNVFLQVWSSLHSNTNTFSMIYT